MKVTFYFPFNSEFRDKKISEVRDIIGEYEKMRKNSLEYLESKKFKILSGGIDPSFVFFHVLQGEIDSICTEILTPKKYPLILFAFCFEISEITELRRKIEELEKKANKIFIQILKPFSENHYLKWKDSPMRYYYIFETSEEDETLIKKIAHSITGHDLQEEYIKSHCFSSEFLKIFCGKTFSVIFFRKSESFLTRKYLQSTRNSIRDTFLFSEIMLRTLQNVAMNSIEQLANISSKEESTWTDYFTDLTDPIRILISNKELMDGFEEKTFGICSKLNALDRILENAKIVVNLRSTLSNESLQRSIDKYTKMLMYLTILILLLTIATVLSSGDSLISNLKSLIFWIQKHLSDYGISHLLCF